MKNIPILIPSYEPGLILIDVVKELYNHGFQYVVIIRDGCGEEYDYVYNQVAKFKNCHIVKHSYNLGKGRALKTGINYCVDNCLEFEYGVVTVDADGQHLTKDIIKVANQLSLHPDTFIFGKRSFDVDTPLRSKIGNKLSKHLISFLLGMKISDTQTGLRGLPYRYFYDLLKLSGERYEYETNMLLLLKKKNYSYQEIDIATVYIENNFSSHFNPIFDSAKIYFVLLSYSLVSLSSFVLDFFLFFFLMFIFGSIGVASYGSRVVSMLYNYYLNKNLVFYNKSNSYKTFILYILLSLVSISCSYVVVRFLYYELHFNLATVKLGTEISLFIFNFVIQNLLIFRKK